MRRIFTLGYLLYLAALLASAAAAYRILSPRWRPATLEDLARPDYQDSPETLIRKIAQDGRLHDLRPHAKATHDGIDYATNGDGLRESHEYPVERRVGVRRVILLGDSFVFGWGLPLEQTIGHQLASLLGDRAWEVLNLGVPGYNTRDEVEFLEERGLKYRPDVVVLMYHPNDAGMATKSVLGDSGTTTRLLTAYYDGTLEQADRPRVEAFLRAQGQPLAPAWNTPTLPSRDRQYFFFHTLPLYWANVATAFDRLATLAREQQFTVVGVIIPEIDRPWATHPFDPLYQQVAVEMRRRGFAVVDLAPVLRHYPNGDLMLWGTDGHTSAYADLIIAHVLAERLRALPASKLPAPSPAPSPSPPVAP